VGWSPRWRGDNVHIPQRHTPRSSATPHYRFSIAAAYLHTAYAFIHIWTRVRELYRDAHPTHATNYYTATTTYCLPAAEFLPFPAWTMV